ncbi:MAG: cytochrome c [Planctomycetota bacterium]|jgi:mono/diheme cytochrome c family protein|nr:cytochrome c [Planctomycetota bacterium]
MSDHSDIPAEKTNPVLWTAALVIFVAVVAWWFAYMFAGGAHHANQNPLAIDAGASGPVEPDHVALIASLADPAVVKEGKAVYAANCTACHGADGGVGTNAAARVFTADAFANGADPYSMYLTLKKGFQGMPAQGGLSAEEKYAVIGFIRETYLKDSNATQYIAVDDAYLAEGGANGPWPAPGGGAEGGDPVTSGKDFVVTVPVAAAMAKAERSADLASIGKAQAQLAAAANKTSDASVANALRVIAGDPKAGAYALALVKAAGKDSQADFLVLVTTPGRNSFQPELALLPQDRLAALAVAIREGN